MLTAEQLAEIERPVPHGPGTVWKLTEQKRQLLAEVKQLREARRSAAGCVHQGPVMVDVRPLLEQCEREDTNPPGRRLLYTEEIRRLLGFAFGPDYSELSAAITALMRERSRAGEGVDTPFTAAEIRDVYRRNKDQPPHPA